MNEENRVKIVAGDTPGSVKVTVGGKEIKKLFALNVNAMVDQITTATLVVAVDEIDVDLATKGVTIAPLEVREIEKPQPNRATRRKSK